MLISTNLSYNPSNLSQHSPNLSRKRKNIFTIVIASINFLVHLILLLIWFYVSHNIDYSTTCHTSVLLVYVSLFWFVSSMLVLQLIDLKYVQYNNNILLSNQTLNEPSIYLHAYNQINDINAILNTNMTNVQNYAQKKYNNITHTFINDFNAFINITRTTTIDSTQKQYIIDSQKQINTLINNLNDIINTNYELMKQITTYKNHILFELKQLNQIYKILQTTYITQFENFNTQYNNTYNHNEIDHLFSLVRMHNIFRSFNPILNNLENIQILNYDQLKVFGIFNFQYKIMDTAPDRTALNYLLISDNDVILDYSIMTNAKQQNYLSTENKPNLQYLDQDVNIFYNAYFNLNYLVILPETINIDNHIDYYQYFFYQDNLIIVNMQNYLICSIHIFLPMLELRDNETQLVFQNINYNITQNDTTSVKKYTVDQISNTNLNSILSVDLNYHIYQNSVPIKSNQNNNTAPSNTNSTGGITDNSTGASSNDTDINNGINNQVYKYSTTFVIGKNQEFIFWKNQEYSIMVYTTRILTDKQQSKSSQNSQIKCVISTFNQQTVITLTSSMIAKLIGSKTNVDFKKLITSQLQSITIQEILGALNY